MIAGRLPWSQHPGQRAAPRRRARFDPAELDELDDPQTPAGPALTGSTGPAGPMPTDPSSARAELARIVATLPPHPLDEVLRLLTCGLILDGYAAELECLTDTGGTECAA